ncbi:MAG: hypothetical protein J5985_08200 [Kiritimatiellae bacterium]|nr:hypothetical protein [Kiritimatiellia bacterium]
MNLPFRGLRLGEVDGAECIRIEGKNNETYPSKTIVKMHYKERFGMPAVDLFWYDGKLKPDPSIMPQVTATLGQVPNTGCLIIGSKGILCSTNDYGQEAYIALKDEEKIKSTMKHPACAKEVIPVTLPRCKGGQDIEFVDACKGIVKAYSDIDHSVPMLEGMLVGCIAQQVPGKLTWNSAAQTFGNPAADALLHPHIRKGWEY